LGPHAEVGRLRPRPRRLAAPPRRPSRAPGLPPRGDPRRPGRLRHPLRPGGGLRAATPDLAGIGESGQRRRPTGVDGRRRRAVAGADGPARRRHLVPLHDALTGQGGPSLPPSVRILLIVNTTASSVTPRARVVIAKALAADHELTVAETTRRGHAERLAHGAANDGFDAVV